MAMAAAKGVANPSIATGAATAWWMAEIAKFRRIGTPAGLATLILSGTLSGLAMITIPAEMRET